MADQKGTFDTSKPLIVNCAEIIGLEDHVGTINFKRLNLKERVVSNVKKIELTQGKEIDTFFDNVAFVLVTLELAITNKPESIILEELEVESLFAMYEKYTAWVETFRTKFRESKKATSKAGVE